MRVLLVEDNVDLAQAIAEGLTRHRFVVDSCRDGDEALGLAMTEPYLGIILDRRLPGMSGLEVCRALRQQGCDVPILFLTARDTVEDRVEGLDAGADDYMVKPFAFTELLARTRALTRRESGRRSNQLKAGDITLDLNDCVARIGDKAVLLTAKEILILAALMRHPGRLLTHDRLVSQAWGYEAEPTTNVVRAHMKNLRKKLQEEGATAVIETIHGLGYRFAT